MNIFNKKRKLESDIVDLHTKTDNETIAREAKIIELQNDLVLLQEQTTANFDGIESNIAQVQNDVTNIFEDLIDKDQMTQNLELHHSQIQSELYDMLLDLQPSSLVVWDPVNKSDDVNIASNTVSKGENDKRSWVYSVDVISPDEFNYDITFVVNSATGSAHSVLLCNSRNLDLDANVWPNDSSFGNSVIGFIFRLLQTDLPVVYINNGITGETIHTSSYTMVYPAKIKYSIRNGVTSIYVNNAKISDFSDFTLTDSVYYLGVTDMQTRDGSFSVTASVKSLNKLSSVDGIYDGSVSVKP